VLCVAVAQAEHRIPSRKSRSQWQYRNGKGRLRLQPEDMNCRASSIIMSSGKFEHPE
jgi:hypothetical protein